MAELIGLLTPRQIALALLHWPSQAWEGWHRYTGSRGEKLASKPDYDVPESIASALWTIARFAQPYLGDSFIDHALHGAGMHWIGPGGNLPRHLDSDRHPVHAWERTHSIVCFLDTMHSGGELILSDGAETIRPIAGQIVMFQCRGNWHWVNPVEQNRRTLALFTWRHREPAELVWQRDRALFEEKSHAETSPGDSCCTACCVAGPVTW